MSYGELHVRELRGMPDYFEITELLFPIHSIRPFIEPDFDYFKVCNIYLLFYKLNLSAKVGIESINVYYNYDFEAFAFGRAGWKCFQLKQNHLKMMV